MPPLPFLAVSLCFTQELSIFLLPENRLGCPLPFPAAPRPRCLCSGWGLEGGERSQREGTQGALIY